MVAALFVCALAATPAAAFDFEDVAREAERLVRAPHRKPPAADAALAMSYDAYRKLRFKAEHATWRDSGSPFEVQYFPLGRGFTRALTLFEVVGDDVRPLRLPPNAFEGTASGAVAGWRLHRWAGEPRRSDEVGAFLGASYFRLVAQGLRYGLSARGLAVDTVGGGGEEFPEFTTYWLQRPQSGDTEVRFYALLESARVTGAYAFVLRPSAGNTVTEVRARLFLRAPVARLGLAPLTSMFLGGENQPPIEDYRPEVHDSDGLQVVSGNGEWLWRPLTNPRGVFVTSFSMPSLRGFGLMQRDRAFSSYEDLESRFEKRPSVWVQPRSKFEAGRVEIVEIPTPDETNDNIVVYWVPDTLPAPLEPIDFEYRMLWQMETETRPPQSWVTQTRRGHGYRKVLDKSLDFVVDFEGPALSKLPRDAEVEPVVTAVANAQILESNAYRNDVTGGYRLTIRFNRQDDAKPVELRAFLRDKTGTLSETWSYLLPPN